MIQPCPACYPKGYEGPSFSKESWKPQGTRPVEKEVSEPATIGVTDGPPDLSEMELPETKRGLRYQRCGHIFSRETLEDVADALQDFKGLRRELNTTEDPNRLRELEEYELPAAENAVNNRWNEVERWEDLEDRIVDE